MRNTLKYMNVVVILWSAALLLFSPVHSANNMSCYSITPPFIEETVKPNLLMMIDNSASMYDLAYPDPGTGSRRPYYCYDHTYKSSTHITTPYSGYFDSNSYYRYNFADNYFEKTETLSGDCSNYLAGTLCINLDSSTPKRVTRFIAKGNYMNWLTASKFDIEKSILTGGKYLNGRLVAESRGCVGRGFVKEALTSDYVEGGSNLPLGITFSIKGAPDPNNHTSPSRGGQTNLYLYLGDYQEAKCQEAISSITTAQNQTAATNAADSCLPSDSDGDLSLKRKEKNIFWQSIKQCLQYSRNTPHTVDNSSASSIKTRCAAIYQARGSGPSGIRPGAPDLICSNDYAGVCYNGSAPDWPSNAWGGCNGSMCGDNCIIESHNRFCASVDAAPVTDPTDDPSHGSSYGNLPAIIGDSGVEAQLGPPLKLANGNEGMTVQIAMESEPAGGLIQQFGDRIRFGGIKFNDYGSFTECTGRDAPSVFCPKVCSTLAEQACGSTLDCPGGGSCLAASNLDGGKIFHYIGMGRCSVEGTIVCATDGNCPTGEKCISDGVGTHASGLVRAIDDIRAATWTPYAETFYNAIGYYAKDETDTTGKSSRTSIRINKTDFNADMNPSQYNCQKNNILLISDGMSTADQKPEVGSLATLYAYPSGETGSCPYYAGSKNLDDLAYLAYNYNINNFSLVLPVTPKPDIGTLKGSQHIKTFVVFNGISNGSAGQCNSETLLSETAARGGTSIYKVGNQAELKTGITAALKEVANSAESGTAASIVNNRGESGANLIAAVFYPEKDFGNDRKIAWIGDLQSYWYYLDPFIANSTIREDTNRDKALDLKEDYKIDFVFEESARQTKVKRYRDDGRGAYRLVAPDVTLDQVEALWKGGVELYKRDITAIPYRKIFINKDNSLFTLTNDKFSILTTGYWGDLKTYLQVSTDDEAVNVMKYIYGYDDIPGYRNRTVSGFAGQLTTDRSKGIGVWKLGDILSSTPKVHSGIPLGAYHLDYGDETYEAFLKSENYANRNMVYAGANDGMFHAFKSGKVVKRRSGSEKAVLQGTNLGREEWAFIPRNALPYLKYFADPEYTHLYYIDNTSLLVDVSINNSTGCSEYWNCSKMETSWKSVLIGGMGLGGSSRGADGSCNSATGTLPDCVKAPISINGFEQLGLSSFFALDVTNPETPSLMWEFSNPGLGYTTSEPVIVRINGKKGAGSNSDDSDTSKNGRWFVIFASGPTGPIEPSSHQFYGKSDQSLKIFIVDLKSGELVRTIDTGIPNAFAGSLSTNALDTDKGNKFSPGYYSTDVVYIGYVKKKERADSASVGGGLLRLVTREDLDPDRWVLSTVIDSVGPITASIEKLYDDKDSLSGKAVLWLYFGAGRYFYKNGTDGIDSADNQMAIYGIKEPCYSTATGPYKDIDPNCSATITSPLTNQSSDNHNASLDPDKSDGWFINLDKTGADRSRPFKAERVVTTPSVRTNGLLLFTTFKPTADICGLGGETFFWLLDYATGAAPSQGVLKGKISVQLSTGANAAVDLSTLDSRSFARGGRQIDVAPGKPPSAPPLTDALKKPIKKVLQIQEK